VPSNESAEQYAVASVQLDGDDEIVCCQVSFVCVS
jgi:hypothetical protein